MDFQKKIILNLNNIFYHLNKYNIFGGLLAYLIAANLNAVTSDSNKFLKTSSKRHFISAVLIVVFFIIIKELVKLILGLAEECECSPNQKTFVQEIRECGNNKGILDVLKNIFITLGRHSWNFTYRYNLLGLIFVLLLGGLSGVVVRTNNLMSLYSLTMILLSLVATKHFFILFFKSQKFCPCDCPDDKCKSKQIDIKELGTELLDNVSGKKEDSVMSSLEERLRLQLGANYDYYNSLKDDLSEIDKVLNDETERLFQEQYDLEKLKNKNLSDRVLDLEKLKPGDSKLLSDKLVDLRIQELCGKNKQFNVLDTKINPEKCLAVINQNKVLKNFVVVLLKDKPAYTCIRDSNSTMAIDACINDYVLKQPKNAEKLVNDYLEIELKELEDIVNEKYPSYKQKNKVKKSKEVVELEKEIERLKKLLNKDNKKKIKKTKKNKKENPEEGFLNYVYSVDSDVKRIGNYEAALQDDFNLRVKKNCEKNIDFYESEEGTVPLFENIGVCTDFIINNSYLRHLFESILMEKEMYNCITHSKDQNNMNECLMRFFTDYPIVLQRVIDMKEKIKGKDVIDQKSILYNFKHMLENDYKFVSKVNKDAKTNESLDKFYKIMNSGKVQLKQPLYKTGEPDYNDPYNLSDLKKLEMPVFSDDYPQETAWPPADMKIKNALKREYPIKHVNSGDTYMKITDL